MEERHELLQFLSTPAKKCRIFVASRAEANMKIALNAYRRVAITPEAIKKDLMLYVENRLEKMQIGEESNKLAIASALVNRAQGMLVLGKRVSLHVQY